MIEWSFWLKKIVAAFCMPVPLFLAFLLLTAVFYFLKYKNIARCLLGFSFLFFYIISIKPTGHYLASQLENQYSSYQKVSAEALDYVLVLGSAHVSDNAQPISSLLSSSGLMRLMEGVRVYRLNPGAKLLLSGYRFRDEISHAEALKKVAMYFGVPEKDIVLAKQVKDTQEEATHWAGYAQGKRLAVVTSASHMPRSIYLFKQANLDKKLGLRLYPSPTDYISHRNTTFNWKDWFPSGQSIFRLERVWHELLGILWAKLNS